MQKNFQRKIHYAWWILAACFMIYGATMGLGVNLTGIFNAAIAEDLGIAISKYTAVTIAGGLISALALMTVVDKIIRKNDLRLVLCLAAILYGSSYILRGRCTKLWQFVGMYLINGFSSSFLLYVPIPLILNAWFHKKAGFAMGITMLSSGVAGLLTNPIMQRLIAGRGWRFASYVNGLLIIVLSVPFILIFIRRSPSELGMRAYGEEEELSSGDGPTGKSEEAAVHYNSLYTPKEKRRLFAYTFVFAIFAYLVSTVPQQLAHFGIVTGLGAANGALLVSCGMAGNMTSKALLGICVDKFGKRNSFALFLSIAILGLTGLSFLYRFPMAVIGAAAFLSGFSACVNTMMSPMLVAEYATGDEYLTFVSRVSVATMISTAFGTYVSSAIYDFTGSYSVEFIFYAILYMIAIAIALRVIPAVRKAE